MLESNKLLIFYLGGPDTEGRTLDQILAQTDDWLETTHNYIQWLFPTSKPSNFNAKAPILDEELKVILSLPVTQKQVIRSFARFLQFLGLKYDQTRILKAQNWNERKKTWLSPNNHNHLRITRILDCLSNLGMLNVAVEFFKMLGSLETEELTCITAKTFNFWKAEVDG